MQNDHNDTQYDPKQTQNEKKPVWDAHPKITSMNNAGGPCASPCLIIHECTVSTVTANVNVLITEIQCSARKWRT